MNILNKEKILEQARALIDEGKFDKAIREYEKILLADPSDLRVKLRIAELYTKRKQINEAIRIYREVADAYSSEGFYLKAVTVHKNILRLNPSLIEVNEQLAELYEKMGLVSDAIRQYDILAQALDRKGMNDRILDIRKKIVKLNPKDGNARIRLAERYQREGEADEAIAEYEEYAKQLEESGADKPKLADIFEKILVHRPDNQEMLCKLINICNELGDQKRTLKWLETGKEVVEVSPELMLMAAKLYAAQNQNETARTKYMALASLCQEQGNADGALDAYYEILVLIPDEEDRIAKKVDEIKAGALGELSQRAAKRRAEIEQEEVRKQEAEESAKAGARAGAVGDSQDSSKKATDAAKKLPSPKKFQMKTDSKEATQEKKEETLSIPVSCAKSVQRKPPVNKQEADAAFNLGMVYKKTGLIEESISEFEKAKSIYSTIAQDPAKDKDQETLKRLKQIEDSLSEIRPTQPAKPARPAK